MDFLPTKITNPSLISVTHPLNYANEPKCVHRLRTVYANMHEKREPEGPLMRVPQKTGRKIKYE